MYDAKEFSNAFSEILEILKYIPRSDYNKIPNELIEVFKNNANKDSKFRYDKTKTLQQQNVSKTARGIIAILYRDYWATSKQKEIILKKEHSDKIEKERKKSEIYSYDKLFKKKEQNLVNKNEKEDSKSITKYKKGIFEKIYCNIKKILGKE